MNAVPADNLRLYTIFPDIRFILTFSIDAKRLSACRMCHEVTDLPHHTLKFTLQLCERSSLGLPTEHSSRGFLLFPGAKICYICTVLLRKNLLFYEFLLYFTNNCTFLYISTHLRTVFTHFCTWRPSGATVCLHFSYFYGILIGRGGRARLKQGRFSTHEVGLT